MQILTIKKRNDTLLNTYPSNTSKLEFYDFWVACRFWSQIYRRCGQGNGNEHSEEKLYEMKIRFPMVLTLFIAWQISKLRNAIKS